MTVRTLIACTAMTLVLGGCKKDPDPFGVGTLRLTLVPTWEGGSFDSHDDYHDVLDHRLQVQLLKFYLADITAIGGNGTALLKDIDLFELTNGSVTREWTLPQGNYSALRFGVGVPEALNHSDPVQYPNEHPLSVSNGMYWTWATLYRFVIFEGRFDSLPDGVGVPPFPFSIHTGHDTCYRTVTLPGSFLVSDDAVTDLVMEVDIARFFHNSNDTLDLTESSQAHGEPELLPVTLLLSDMVEGSFQISEEQ